MGTCVSDEGKKKIDDFPYSISALGSEMLQKTKYLPRCPSAPQTVPTEPVYSFSTALSLQGFVKITNNQTNFPLNPLIFVQAGET